MPILSIRDGQTAEILIQSAGRSGASDPAIGADAER